MKKIEILLTCSTATTIELLKKHTSPATGLRLLSSFAEPMFWARISESKVVIWPKGGKDLSATKMKLNIISTKEGALLTGIINNYNLFKVSGILLIISLISFFFGFIGSVLLFLSANDIFFIVLILTVISFLIFFVGLIQRISEYQEEELVQFINNVFRNYIKNQIIV